MCCVSPRQRCGTGCSCGVSSPRSSSTGRWGCSCWSCCSATRGAASSPWCWSAWVSWPHSPEASSPVSPVIPYSFYLFVNPFLDWPQQRSASSEPEEEVRWQGGIESGMEGACVITPVKQRKIRADRETERFQTLVFPCLHSYFCFCSTGSHNYITLRKINVNSIPQFRTCDVNIRMAICAFTIGPYSIFQTHTITFWLGNV